MQHQWKLISRLPAVFPDGTPLHERIYPWLLNTWVFNFSPHIDDKEKKNPLSRVRATLVVFLAWYSTPLVVFAFWLRYLPRHDYWIWYLVFLFAFAGTMAIVFHLMAEATLQNHSMSWSWVKFWSWVKSWSWVKAISFLFTALLAFTLYYFSNMAISRGGESCQSDITRSIQRLILYADFSGQEVFQKPDNWDPNNPAQGVIGADLESKNLTCLKADSAFLVKANLSGANLIGANLTEAILFEANLNGAVIAGSDFRKTKGLTIDQIKSAENWEDALFDNDRRIELGITDEKVREVFRKILGNRNQYLPEKDLEVLLQQELTEYGIKDPKKAPPENK
jgi:hypothetical protein